MKVTHTKERFALWETENGFDVSSTIQDLDSEEQE
jgi:hypothetical protein